MADIRRDDAAGQHRFAEAMEERRQRDESGEWKAVRRGWFLGGAELKERLLMGDPFPAFKWLTLFMASQLVFIAIGLIPLRCWVSFRALEKAKGDSDAKAPQTGPNSRFQWPVEQVCIRRLFQVFTSHLDMHISDGCAEAHGRATKVSVE